MTRTFDEINEKIRKKQAVVVTAEEMIGIVREKGTKQAAQFVDVVTTGTFGPMCSSCALVNVGHTVPRMKMQKAWFNDVPASHGLAAVDCMIGASSLPESDPLNKVYPGKFKYGGGHVIEDLVRGRDIVFRAVAYGTDCYPAREFKSEITLDKLPTAMLLNPRNAYQNYNVAVNAFGTKPLYTYMGILLPGLANANYCSAGQLSPLLNDPYYRTIGTGTRIFLGGGTGYVISQGTQHNPSVPRTERGLPMAGSGTIAVTGDLKRMTPEFLRGASIPGYGVSLAVGLGIPIPVLDEEMAYFTSVEDSDIIAPVVDYSERYPNGISEPLGHVSYAELRSGYITLDKRKIKTAALSSYPKARQIAIILKTWIANGTFTLSRPSECLPGTE